MKDLFFPQISCHVLFLNWSEEFSYVDCLLVFILPKGTVEPVIRSSDLVLYFIQSGVVDSQIDPNNIQKSIYRSKLKL